MNTVSFMTANFVARQLGYRMTGGWGQGDTAANAYFAPIETYPERFDALLREVRAMGFGAIDLWLAHLHWSWATDAHLEVAHDLLQRHALRVVSLAGGFGGTADEFARTCRIANAVGTDTLGGSTPLLAADRPKLVEALGAFGLRLAIENHPERDPDELLATIGDGADGRIGTALDTGWYATHGSDPARAIEALGGHVLHVHLKDIRAAGAHDTVGLGQGIVPIAGCVRVLQEIGYAGPLSIEHEPEDRDPTAECVASLEKLRGWLGRRPASSTGHAGRRSPSPTPPRAR